MFCQWLDNREENELVSTSLVLAEKVLPVAVVFIPKQALSLSLALSQAALFSPSPRYPVLLF